MASKKFLGDKHVPRAGGDPPSWDKCHFVVGCKPRGNGTQQLTGSKLWRGSFTSWPEPERQKDYLSSWPVLASVSSSRSGRISQLRSRDPLQLKIFQRYLYSFLLQPASGIPSIFWFLRGNSEPAKKYTQGSARNQNQKLGIIARRKKVAWI